MKPRTYEGSGVSIERGDAFASYLAGLTSSAIGELGGFAGGVVHQDHAVPATGQPGIAPRRGVAREPNARGVGPVREGDAIGGGHAGIPSHRGAVQRS